MSKGDRVVKHHIGYPGNRGPVVEMRVDEHRGKYKLTGDANPDTYLLAEMLRAEFQDVMGADVGVALDLETRSSLAWYRVAERAKELRA